MRKTISILIFGMLLLNIVLVAANEGHESGIEEGEKLVESEISCDKLTDEQLETIGEYYMEQMHPGEAHEMMHDMMGGHDSETVKLMHINMANSIYCGETNQNMMGMMMGGNGMMGGMMSGGMMGGRGMMGNYDYQNLQNNGVYQNSSLVSQIFFYIIPTLVIVVLILVIMLLINKLKKGGKK